MATRIDTGNDYQAGYDDGNTEEFDYGFSIGRRQGYNQGKNAGIGSIVSNASMGKVEGIMLIRSSNGGLGARDPLGVGDLSLSYSQSSPYSGSWIDLFEGGIGEARPDLLITLSCKEAQCISGIYFYYVGNGEWERYFKDYYVEYSDDNTLWIRCYNVTGAAYRTGQHIVEHFMQSTHKYWRFHYTSANSNPWAVKFDFIKSFGGTVA